MTTHSGLGGIGGGAHDRADPPSRRRIDQEILPTLRLVLRDAKRSDPDTIASSAVALAKATDDPIDVVRIVERMNDRSLPAMAREAAALALGCLRRTAPPPAFDGRFYDSVRTTLFDVLDDARETHRLRANAAFSLGMLGDQGVTSGDAFAKDGRLTTRGLWIRLERPDVDDDLAVSLLVALSLQSPAGVPTAVVDGLRRLALAGEAGRRRRGSLPRAHAVLALARLGCPAAIPIASNGLRAGSLDVRRSCAIALGLSSRLLEGGARLALVDRLLDHARSGEPNTAGLALVSAARALAADLEAAGVSEERLARLERIVSASERGSHTVRPFAAIAAGIVLRPEGRVADDASFVTARDGALARLRAIWENPSLDPSLRGGFAIALGIASDVKSIPILAAAVADRANPDLVAYACAGLGLIGDVPVAARAALRTALTDRSSDAVRLEAARALGLLGDARAVPALLAGIEAGGSDVVLARAVVALGGIRDASSVSPLCALVRRPGVSDATRALACAGLGLLADGEEVRAIARLGIDSNYLAVTDALAEALGLL